MQKLQLCVALAFALMPATALAESTVGFAGTYRSRSSEITITGDAPKLQVNFELQFDYVSPRSCFGLRGRALRGALPDTQGVRPGGRRRCLCASGPGGYRRLAELPRSPDLGLARSTQVRRDLAVILSPPDNVPRSPKGTWQTVQDVRRAGDRIRTGR